MIKDYQGCEKHRFQSDLGFDPDCTECIKIVTQQQTQDENDNHSESEEIEYIVLNQEEIEV